MTSTLTTGDRSSTDPRFIIHHPQFAVVLGKEPQFHVLAEVNAHEGPVYVEAEAALYFTTVPVPSDVPLAGSQRVAIERLSLDVSQFPFRVCAKHTVQADANMANGMTLDRDGRLLICEQGTRITPARISRMELASGRTEPLVESWRGLRFNSPNDIVVKSDGTVWFTDPAYGALQKFKDAPMLGNYVYRHDPDSGSTSVVADAFNKPNGLAFSPDESVLYINDSGAIQEPGSYYPNLPHHILAFDVLEGRRLNAPRLFAVISPGIPDGLKVDSNGNVYSTSASGLQVFNPQGDLLGEILAPGIANFCFSGPERNVLLLLADSAIYQVRVAAHGAGPAAPRR